jgi:hypothetical protein
MEKEALSVLEVPGSRYHPWLARDQEISGLPGRDSMMSQREKATVVSSYSDAKRLRWGLVGMGRGRPGKVRLSQRSLTFRSMASDFCRSKFRAVTGKHSQG